MTKRVGSSNLNGPRDAPEDASLRADFIAAMARWASGVTIVSVRDDSVILATTATAFCSASLDPPLVLVCLGRNASVLPALASDARFAISILAAAQHRIASMFTDPAPIGRAVFAASGAPVVTDALAGLSCSVDALHPAGDHVIVVARVLQVIPGADGAAPLIRYERAWR